MDGSHDDILKLDATAEVAAPQRTGGDLTADQSDGPAVWTAADKKEDQTTDVWRTGGQMKGGWRTGGQMKGVWRTGGQMKGVWRTGGQMKGVWRTGGQMKGGSMTGGLKNGD